MKHEEMFEKVVVWKRLDLNGKNSFIIGFILLIPIINFIPALALISMAWDGRKVFWRKVGKKRK